MDGDRVLQVYFDGLADLELLTPEQEREVAEAVVDSEVNLWSELLSLECVAGDLLASLRFKLDGIEDADLAKVDALLELLTHGAHGGDEWLRACADLGSYVRLLDTDREWTREAVQRATSVVTG